MISLGLVGLSACLFMSCSGLFSDDDQMKVAYIDWYFESPGLGPLFLVPDTVVAGTSSQVEFRTLGLDGCYSLGRTEVKRKGEFDVTVRGFDRSGGGTCPSIDVFFTHEASVRFDEPGDARVRILGRHFPSGEEVEVLREVVVLPR